jgi:hypothetical protein
LIRIKKRDLQTIRRKNNNLQVFARNEAISLANDGGIRTTEAERHRDARRYILPPRREGTKKHKGVRVENLIVVFQSSIIELIEISYFLTLPVPTNGGIILRHEGSVCSVRRPLKL